jgi:hypothetical protein
MEDAAEAWDAGGGVGGALLGLDASFEAGAATHADLSDLCDSEELAALATAHAAPHSYGRVSSALCLWRAARDSVAWRRSLRPSLNAHPLAVASGTRLALAAGARV